MTACASPPTASDPDHLRADIVVIGAGPGGAIAAALLADAGREVVLIEEGPHLPLESAPPFSRDEIAQKYRNGGITVAMGAAKIAYVEGCCVGGGSEINRGLYQRLPLEVLDGVAQGVRHRWADREGDAAPSRGV